MDDVQPCFMVHLEGHVLDFWLIVGGIMSSVVLRYCGLAWWTSVAVLDSRHKLLRLLASITSLEDVGGCTFSQRLS